MYSTKATATTWHKHDNQSSYAVAVVPLVHWPMYLGVPNKRPVSFSSYQRNLLKTFQIEGMIALIKKWI